MNKQIDLFLNRTINEYRIAIKFDNEGNIIDHKKVTLLKFNDIDSLKEFSDYISIELFPKIKNDAEKCLNNINQLEVIYGRSESGIHKVYFDTMNYNGKLKSFVIRNNSVDINSEIYEIKRKITVDLINIVPDLVFYLNLDFHLKREDDQQYFMFKNYVDVETISKSVSTIDNLSKIKEILHDTKIPHCLQLNNLTKTVYFKK